MKSIILLSVFFGIGVMAAEEQYKEHETNINDLYLQAAELVPKAQEKPAWQVRYENGQDNTLKVQETNK